MSNIEEVHGKTRLHVSVNLLLGVWPPCCAIRRRHCDRVYAPASNAANHNKHKKIRLFTVPYFFREIVDVDRYNGLMIRKGAQSHSRRQKKAEIGKGGEGGRVGIRTGKLYKFPFAGEGRFWFAQFFIAFSYGCISSAGA